MASAAEIAETETEIAELTNQLAEAERMCQQQQDAASETEAKIAQLTNQLAAADKKEEEQEQEEEKKEEAFELSDSEDDDEEEDEMEVELAQMRADIAANDQAIKDLHLRIAASESVDAEMAAMRAQLELTEASVGAEEQATILACPDEGTGSSKPLLHTLSSTLRSESLSDTPPHSFSHVSQYMRTYEIWCEQSPTISTSQRCWSR